MPSVAIVQVGLYHSEIIPGVAYAFMQMGYQVYIFADLFAESMLHAAPASIRNLRRDAVEIQRGGPYDLLYVNSALEYELQPEFFADIKRQKTMLCFHSRPQLRNQFINTDGALPLVTSLSSKITADYLFPVCPVWAPAPELSTVKPPRVALVGSHRDPLYLSELLNRRDLIVVYFTMSLPPHLAALFEGTSHELYLRGSADQMWTLFRQCQLGTTLCQRDSYGDVRFSGCLSIFAQIGLPVILSAEMADRYQLPERYAYSDYNIAQCAEQAVADCQDRQRYAEVTEEFRRAYHRAIQHNVATLQHQLKV